MKFSFKLLLWTMIVMALGFGFSGYYFVNYVFQTSMDREVNQAMDESSILRFAFETAALNVPAKYDVLQDTRTYRVIEQDGAYYIQTGTAVNALDRVLYLETMKDVSEVFRDRSLGFSVYRRVTVAMLLCGTAVMYLIASFLTRPIRLLTRATKRMASGDYHHRARKVSSDELGQLTTDFNQMANALEDNINQLEDEIQAREDFVAAFAHELKTPLTSIIGYADALRSRRLDEEKQFMSANYIYTEGKRLEAMSFRLLDIMVTRRGEAEFTMVSAESLFLYLYDMYVINKSMKIYFNYDDGMVRAEANLIKSVLMNLLDNAFKASEADGLIEVYGHLMKDGYCFEVKDHGVGIPKEELHKITKAFYMVDKSRSRSRNGAGLGLALCAEILELHKSRLNIRSELGKGTTMSFTLPLWKEDQL